MGEDREIGILPNNPEPGRDDLLPAPPVPIPGSCAIAGSPYVPEFSRTRLDRLWNPSRFIFRVHFPAPEPTMGWRGPRMDDLIAKWVAGDEAAAEALYRTYFIRVRDFMERRGTAAADADDLAQEALIAGLDGLKSGTRPAKLTAWLYGIAKNLAKNRTRLYLDDDLDPEDPSARTSRSLVIRREMKDFLDRSLRTLPPAEREIIELSHRQGLSRKEIADRLEIAEDAVHARFKRAHGRLREALSRRFTTLVASRLKREAIALADVEALRPGFRSAVTAVHLEGLSPDQAALKLGVPLATLRARLRSAYEILGYDEAPDFGKAREEFRVASGPLNPGDRPR